MKKLNKKGFTLVELLAVIVILGLLMSVAVGAVTMYMDKSKEQAMETIISTAYDGAVNTLMEENIMLNEGETTTFDILELYENGSIERPADPYNSSKECEGYVKVTNPKASSSAGIDNYQYKVHIECTGNRIKEKIY